MRFDLTVNEFVRDVLGSELVVFGEQFWRPYVHVRDAARVILLVLAAPSEAVSGVVFNVGATAENYRKLDLLERLIERFPELASSFVLRTRNPGTTGSVRQAPRSELGFEPERSVADGIDEVKASLLEERSHWRPVSQRSTATNPCTGKRGSRSRLEPDTAPL